MHEKTDSFHTALAPYMSELRRDLPWRNLSIDDSQRFYEVLVSEMMLQQTQVGRVVEKYNQWMIRFPTLNSLAEATFTDVLKEWSGLGYSRRSKYLFDISKDLKDKNIPIAIDELVAYKGIGVNTGGAILAYYKNLPTLFIETNVRTVFFHHFFDETTLVHDKDIEALMQRLIDTKHPREWYWAFIDYRTDLKKQVRNIQQSKHYKKQSKFEGSDRQLRARLLRKLMLGGVRLTDALELVESKQYILDSLLKEGMIVQYGHSLSLPG
jgi:A/G-specific adenine glycosylase